MIMKFLMEEAWIAEVFFIFIGAIFLAYGIEMGYRYLKPYLSHARILSNRVLFYAIYRPFQVLLIVMGAYIAFNILHRHVGIGHPFALIPTIKNVALLAIVLWFFLRILYMAEKELIINRALKSSEIARLDMIFKVLRMSVIVLGAVILLPMMDIDISGLLALGGVGGILAGLMAKDVLANTVGGLMIYVDSPFSKGDWIRLPDKNIEGTVANIAWRLTAIRLPNHQLMYIPNAAFMTTAIENYSRMKRRRLALHAEIIYKKVSQIDEIIETLVPAIQNALSTIDEIDMKHPISVTTTGFEATACHILINVYIKAGEQADFQTLKQSILLKVFNTVSEHGFECTALTQK